MALVGDGELAVAEGVPKLDCAVTGTGDDLAVVGGEGDGEDIVGVANKSSGGVAGGELPEAESLVPRGGKSVGAVRGDNLRSPTRQSVNIFNSSQHRSLVFPFPPLTSRALFSRPCNFPLSSLLLVTPNGQAGKKKEKAV